LRRQGLYRVAFFGPAYSPPAPLKVIPVDWPAVKSEQAATRRAQSAFKKLDQLITSHGPEYHIELKFLMPPIFQIWRGEDWLAYHTAEFYLAEVALLLGRNITESRWMEPDAILGKTIKAGRSKGSEATKAHAAQKAIQFKAEFKRVAQDPLCQKWSKDAQIEESIKRLKRQKIRISRSSAYAYLTPKK
jgi:hypothetical protein